MFAAYMTQPKIAILVQLNTGAIEADREKIAAYACALMAAEMPIGSTTAGKRACAEIGVIVDRVLAEIRTIYTSLK